ncbi:FAD-dependent oxidoreductase [Bacillus sp. PS06]|uniref:FAD-dependent oxidoreductase n=1 Tax=Bacillus sp. PS06 TaxID=2764176 RepID=UPI00177E5317|nr:FAD-dependent oxidoreductase [Bacillus sp. PS06]MBD8071555.1 FAD-dependent oxidoreductase [Bacillus sp. PS06]
MSFDQKLPESIEPFWREGLNIPEFPKLEKDLEVDVVIVGGGITGLTSAYVLVNEGLKVAVIEANKLVNGTSGHTTAKITAQHDLIYDEFIQHFGRSKARLYYEANIEALQFIKKTVEEHQIDCDFKEQDAYLYSTTDEYAEKIKTEAKAYKTLGIDGGIIDQIPFDIKVKNALVMKNQAQFHPVKYLAHLIKLITDKGGLIFEETVAVNVETGEKPTVITRDGKRATGGFVIACSHFPFFEGLGLYSTRMYADRSYVVAVKANTTYPEGMYLSVDQPSRSLRSASNNGEEVIIIGGGGHKTGQATDTMKEYNHLADFSEQVFEVKEMVNRWSAQDLTTLDKVPYIGELTTNEPNILVGTGYRKWGMTSSTVAALLFRDIILKRQNNYRDLYSPSRFYADPSLKNFLLTNMDVAKHLIKGKMDIPQKSVDDIPNGEAAVISFNGHRKGAFKDEEGKVFIVDTTCTHVGCEVAWNNGEKTWDCPCHGSRFSYTGEVIEGPAEKPLQQYDFTMLDIITSEDSGY